MKTVFDAEARKYDVYPLSDATLARALPANRPSLLGDRTSVTYFADHVRIPETATLTYTSTSFELRAQLQIPRGGAQGVVICIGGAMAGWTLYLQGGIPIFVYNYLGHELTTVAAPSPLPEGPVALGLSFAYDGGGLGKGAAVSLLVDDAVVVSGRVERTVPFRFSMSGETLDVGVDTGSPVAPYGHAFRFTGRYRPNRRHRSPAARRSGRGDGRGGDARGTGRAIAEPVRQLAIVGRWSPCGAVLSH